MDLLTKCAVTDFRKLFIKKHYTYYTSGCYNLNIIGVRSKQVENKNSFEDVMVVEYFSKAGNFCQDLYIITTTPGITALVNPMSPFGCAILKEGQYKKAFTFGLHKGKYEALVQNTPLTVYRDINKDVVLDVTETTFTQTGMFGINIHAAGANSIQVDNWSAGCQVFKRREDFSRFMNTCKQQEINGKGRTFTYTLINEKDLV